MSLRLRLTVAYLFRKSALWRNRKAWRAWQLRRGTQIVGQVLAQFGWREAVATMPTLVERGGIMADPAAIAKVREFAYTWAEEKAQHTVAVQDWDQRIVADILRLVRSRGGEVVFFEMPISSVMALPYETPESHTSILAFSDWSRRNQCPLIKTGFVSTDADFPDLWHLGISRSAEFSRLLATSWVRSRGVTDGEKSRKSKALREHFYP